MRPPRQPKSPVDQARKNAWLEDFVGYRIAVNQGRIEAWLKQFSTSDRDTAARVLDTVEFFGPDRIAHAYRTGLSSLPGWSKKAAERDGRWRFSPMSGSAGDSAGTMVHHFRLANKMASSAFDEMFVFPSELMKQQLGPEDTVVLLDDFIGTGQQVTDAWKEAFSELVAGAGTVYLMVVAARSRGRERVQQETQLVVHAGHEFDESDNLFSDGCHYFTAKEKEKLWKYCVKANKKEPAGYGDCGLTVVFAHRCPNNSLAALHAVHPKWVGLFPRHD